MNDTMQRPPTSLPEWLAELARSAPAKPVPLRGTSKQVGWAEQLRKVRLTYVRAKRDETLLAALSLIEDSTWWLANRDAPLAELDWPSPDQVARTERPA